MMDILELIELRKKASRGPWECDGCNSPYPDMIANLEDGDREYVIALVNSNIEERFAKLMEVMQNLTLAIAKSELVEARWSI